ncbi:MAG: hypothetical protein KA236_16440, partial [Verrucomicrobia bacterium]|nr:hypothetical protein [Verrucomicrobiota bacterium]
TGPVRHLTRNAPLSAPHFNRVFSFVPAKGAQSIDQTALPRPSSADGCFRLLAAAAIYETASHRIQRVLD